MVFVPFTGVDNHKRSVTFGAALMSKEDIESYQWVFDAFLRCMGREPVSLITDQCPAMKQAIPAVFKNSMHRLCMWHIMKKITSKVGASMKKITEFIGKLNRVIWDDEITAEEFEEGWWAVINEYDLSDNDWLNDMYAIRDTWIPAYFRDVKMSGFLRTTSRSESENSFFSQFLQPGDTLIECYNSFESAMDKQRNSNAKLNHESTIALPTLKTPLEIEKDAADVYTRAVFYDVQSEIKSACYDLMINSLTQSDDVKSLEVKDMGRQGRMYLVGCSDLCIYFCYYVSSNVVLCIRLS